MAVCPASVTLVLLIYIVLSKVMLFVSIRYAGEKAGHVIVSLMLFDMIFLLGNPLLLAATGGICPP